MALQASPPRETQLLGHAIQLSGEDDPLKEVLPAEQSVQSETLSLDAYFPIGHARQPKTPPEPNWPLGHAEQPSTPEVPEYKRLDPGGHPPEFEKSMPQV